MHRWNRFIAGLAAIVLVLGLAEAASAKTVYLRAAEITKKLANGKEVKIWGYAQCTSFGSGCGAVQSPGPDIVVDPQDNSLTIVLENKLPQHTSIVIPGQLAKMFPVKVNGRVFSFTAITPPNNTTPVYYRWNNLKPGTFLYQSGADPSVQVQMGLYGMVRKDASAGNAYGSPETAYQRQMKIILGEIDPKLHKAVASGNYGPGKAVKSTIGYDPRYYLVNGQPYSPVRTPSKANPGQKILVRFLNAGFEDHTVVVQGAHMSVVAEDGNKLPFPKNAYSVLLPAGKTVDAIVGPLEAGYYPIYAQGIASGQALMYLKVNSPTQYTVDVIKTGGGRVEMSSLPGGLYCGTDCSEAINEGTSITLKAIPGAGKAFLGWTGNCGGTDPVCVLDMTANRLVGASFTP